MCRSASMHERMGWTLVLLMAGSLVLGAQPAKPPARPAGGIPIVLWPDGAPNALGKDEPDIPTLTPFWPEKPADTGTAIIVCPGGSYDHLSMQREGSDVATWLNSIGIPAFVLKYRVGPRYRYPTSLTDAQRAMRWVRAHAADFQLKADRIGMLGFSAGGHLSAMTGTHLVDPKADAADPIDRVDARPDFLVLAYPVISMFDPIAHKKSRENLLGPSPAPKMLDELSNQNHVTNRTPPTFIFHTDDDPGVPVENAVEFYTALKKAGVPAEMHIYAHGKHGVGLGGTDPILATWPARLADWLRGRGLL
jgi:acetyl esterase/lipase